MNALEFASALCALSLLAYCYFEDSQLPPPNSGGNGVDFDTFYAWLTREIILPMLQQMAKAIDSLIVYPDEAYDVMPSNVVNLPQVKGATTCVYEIDVRTGKTVNLSQLEKQLTHRLRRALAKRLQIPVSDPCMKKVSVKLMPNASGAVSMIVYIDNGITQVLCKVITACYAQPPQTP